MKRLDFIIPFRPLSLQAKDRPAYQGYKHIVAAIAANAWAGQPVQTGEINVSMVFLCDARAPIDVDNIVKPIQDAMTSVVYEDDVLVADADSHRRYLQDTIDLTFCPRLLIEMILAGEEAVYVRVRNSRTLGGYL